MADLSVGAAIAWQVAAGEAAHAHHKFIEKEHLFIGICKVGDFLYEEVLRRLSVNPQGVECLRPEANAIDDVFRCFELDRARLRRHLRTKMRPGNYEHVENVIHDLEQHPQAGAPILRQNQRTDT